MTTTHKRVSRKRTRFSWKTALMIVINVICITFLAWIFISWVNVVANNIDSPEKIWDWNAFTVLVENYEATH